MNETVLEQISDELNAINKNMGILTKTIQATALSLYCVNYMAAKITSAKTDYDRNESIRAAEETYDLFKKELSEIA